MDALPEVSQHLLPLGIALALGLMIGLERGWSSRGMEHGTRVAGVRTYGLIGLLGGISGLIALETTRFFPGLVFLGLAAALITARVQAVERTRDLGVTSLIASLLTFAFGAAVALGYMAEASAAAVVTAFLLGSKPQMHGWIQALEEDELRAGLKLLLISVVVLPVLPDQGYGPWQALNPFKIWWMVVLIAAISFAGYFAMRLAGPGKGAALTGLLAGLASSTALTLHFSRLARHRSGQSDILAAGILLACGTMFPRMLAVASLLNPELFTLLLGPAAAMSVVVYGGAAFLWFRIRRKPADEIESGARLKNPLDLKAAIGFGAILALVMLAAEALERGFGGAGVMALAAVSGITDVDAITLTLANRTADSGLALAAASFAIVLAGAVNSLVKGGMTLAIGGRAIALRAAGTLALAALVGLVVAGMELPVESLWTEAG